MKKAMINYMQSAKNDELYTPEYAIKPLLKYLNNIIIKEPCVREYNKLEPILAELPGRKPIIWECTDYGSSNITKILKENGYEVITTHLNTNFDFLKDNPTFEYDIIITNPPYSLKDEFLARCYELNKPFALLLPLTALEGINRGKMFRKRCDFLDNKKSNWFNTSWFCKDILPRDLIFEEMIK